jgi:23S rRNA (adenine2503-C2)-methyltransferase
VLGLDRSALREMLAAQGEPPFRADQLLEWIYAKDAQSFDVMSNLPKRLREQLALTATIGRARLAAQSVAADATHKLLFTWPDGRAVESVWIPEDGRHTVCISSQVGCPVGCRFCASGIDGVERDLAAGEIVEQVWHVRRIVARDGPTAPDGEPARLSNVVFMGMGEPLANYDNVVKAIRIINADWGLGLGARKITLSTVGLPKQIRRLADEGLQINLALSLHAPDEALRQELIPWGKVPIADLIDACRYFFDKTGREVTLEYVLLAGVNMTRQHATRLAIICRKLRCNVNLLRYNPVAGLPFERPSAAEAAAFQQALRGQGVNAHIRRSRGSDVDAACGQLRRRLQPTDADLGLPSRDAPI